MSQSGKPVPTPKSGQAAQKAINDALKNNREAVIRAIAKQSARDHAGSLRYLRDK
jgi:hypothetical protein